MKKRKAKAQWRGQLKDGKGSVTLGSGVLETNYSFRSRFKEGEGTNPEELIGAAHSGCFSMALAGILEESGFTAERISTEATVVLDEIEDDFRITKIELSTDASVPNIEDHLFQEKAQEAKENCPVSKALTGPKITLQAKLTN